MQFVLIFILLRQQKLQLKVNTSASISRLKISIWRNQWKPMKLKLSETLDGMNLMKSDTSDWLTSFVENFASTNFMRNQKSSRLCSMYGYALLCCRLTGVWYCMFLDSRLQYSNAPELQISVIPRWNLMTSTYLGKNVDYITCCVVQYVILLKV